MSEVKQKRASNKSSWSPCCVPREKKAKREENEVTSDEMKKEQQETRMMSNIQEDPPYVQDLPQEMAEGTCLTIKGYLKPICNRFAVNLCCDKEPDCDIALHLNPRLSQKYVVRNHREKTSWGKEETTSINKFNFERKQYFTLDIVCTSKEFLIACNQKHVCAYIYRIPLERIKTLRVEGPVNVLETDFRKIDKYPEKIDLYTVPFSDPDAITNHKLTVPLTAHLPQGFQQGWQLEIYGRTKILPHSFYINLQDGPRTWPHPNVHLHLNPRFNVCYGKHVLVRNAWLDGEWGPEERSSGFHFSPGAHFGIAIRRGDDDFSVWIDGQLAGEFQFRSKVDSVDTVFIHGDVFIEDLHMVEKTSDKFFGRSKENDVQIRL